MTEVRLAPGLHIGEYILESRIGMGGMGEVWRARQPLIETTVAIKILTFESAARKSQVERFLREARAVNRIQHRNLAKIFSFSELSDGRPYFVMEFLAGDNLREFLKKSGALPYATIYHIAEQMCLTLLAAHEVSVIHRDLKPENIFLVTDPGSLPFIKILDFGVAKLSDKDPLTTREHPTQTGATLGTPGYMSPEQYENSKTVDERADIYSMAVIIFEMVCGQHPFEIAGETAYVVIARQLSSDPQKPSTVNPSRHIPKELDTFLLRALSRKPEERPASCKEFLHGFQQALGDLRLERELPTQTQLNDSYDSIRIKSVLPSIPTPTKVGVEDILFSDESRNEAKNGTYPAIQLEENRLNTEVPPPPISNRPKLDDDVTITGTTEPLSEIESSNEFGIQQSTALEGKKLRPEMIWTTPDAKMPESVRDLLTKRALLQNEEVTPDAPTAAYQMVPVNTPAPISVTTTPEPKLQFTKALIVIGAGAFLLILLGWVVFFTSESKRVPPNKTTSAQVTTASIASPLSLPTQTQTPKPSNKEPKIDLCKKEREESREFMLSSEWEKALLVLAQAQDKCPKDPEVQRLFGHTYEQKGDIGFACIRYNTALSFGLSGAAANKTKKSINELKCQ
jgi:serine/threonine protein kinase